MTVHWSNFRFSDRSRERDFIEEGFHGFSYIALYLRLCHFVLRDNRVS